VNKTVTVRWVNGNDTFLDVYGVRWSNGMICIEYGALGQFTLIPIDLVSRVDVHEIDET
jgi:hypothetical protein